MKRITASSVSTPAYREGAQGAKSSDRAKYDVMQVPSFEIPLSRYLSEEGKSLTTLMGHALAKPAPVSESVTESRAMQDAAMTPILNTMREIYDVDITDDQIAGVAVRIITPAQGIKPENKDRVLINLHGGAFFRGANVEALIESIPVAAVAGIKVITVDYRMGPEHKYPAGTVDAVSVYREILKNTESKNVGIYGCSAGGSLTAMVVAALLKDGVSLPGAIGLFSSGAYGDFIGNPLERGTWGGDSRYFGAVLSSGSTLPIGKWEEGAVSSFVKAYLSDTDVSDPQVSPAESPELLEKFPPTLILTGTRAYDMSAAVETHRRLVKNGVDAALHVWDGVGHCFMFIPTLPESKEAYDVIGKFFNSRLG
jgi:monoterpene epsilon-lactone hydrolase